MSNWSLTEHLTTYLEKPRDGEPRHPTLWPSEGSAVYTNEHGEEVVAGKCRRNTFFRYLIANYEFSDYWSHWEPLVKELKEKETDVDRYMRWVWRAGNLFEDHVIDLAKNTGVFITEQISVFNKEYNIGGKIDLQIINPETHKLAIVEIKSIYGHHNAKAVFGSPADVRQKKLTGAPRDSNLIQIAIYDWHWAAKKDDHEHSRLLYGARDTGRFAEYAIKTEPGLNAEGEEEMKIFYKLTMPFESKWVESPITITSILNDGYKYVIRHLVEGIIPPRDFELSYSQEKIDKLYLRGDFSATDTKAIKKIKDREEENAKLIAEGKKPKRELKAFTKGDWQCQNCKYRAVCYNKDGEPREL